MFYSFKDNDATEKELKHDSNNNNNEDHYYSFEAWFDQMRNSCHIESFGEYILIIEN